MHDLKSMMSLQLDVVGWRKVGSYTLGRNPQIMHEKLFVMLADADENGEADDY